MATRAEMEHFVSKLKTDTTLLKWNVCGLPVVALFHNKDTSKTSHLGQSLSRNAQGDILVLWVASNRETGEMLVTLTIRINVASSRAGRKRGHRKGRLMFLIVSPESLSLCCASIDYSALPNYIVHDMPSDVQSAKCKLLHLSFDIGSATSYVIMPEYPCKTEVPAQPMLLLSNLRILSEVTCFDLYANHDDAVQLAIDDVCAMLREHSMTTPIPDLKGLYPGGRPACINLWANQGFSDGKKEVKATHIAQRSSTTQQPPPPYEPQAISAPSLINAANHLGHASAATSKLATSNAPQSERIFSSVSSEDPSTPDASLSSNYSTALLSAASHVVPASVLAASADPNLEGFQSQFSTAKRHRPSVPNGAASTPSCPPDINDPVPDSFSKKRQKSLPPQSPRPFRLPDMYRLYPPGMSLSPTVADEMSYRAVPAHVAASTELAEPAEPARSALPTTKNSGSKETSVNVALSVECHHQEITSSALLSHWLVQAWQVRPNAHYICIAELLRLAAAAIDGDETTIISCRVACTLALLEHCTKEELAKTPSRMFQSRQVVCREIPPLISWLYSLDPEADMELFPALLKLSLFCETEFSAHNHAASGYTRLKAELVGDACMLYSKKVLSGHGEGNVLSKMMQEKDRLKM